MSLCAFVCVNNLYMYVCNLTNNAKNILSINAIIIYSFSIFLSTKKKKISIFCFLSEKKWYHAYSKHTNNINNAF